MQNHDIVDNFQSDIHRLLLSTMAIQQPDLFLPTIADVRPRDVRDLMAHNLFALGSYKRTQPIEHYFGNNNSIIVRGNEEFGIANVYDQDLLLFLISSLQEQIDRGHTIDTQDQLFNIYDFAKFRGVRPSRISGKTYQEIRSSLKRLTSTTIETNVRGEWGIFPMLAGATTRDRDIIRRDKFDVQNFRVRLPPWLFEAVVKDRQVLSFSRDYFTIRGMLRRFVFLYSRKAIGTNKTSWSESLQSFMPKTGTLSNPREFRRLISKLSDRPILNYTTSLDGDTIHFRKLTKKGD